MSHYYNHIVRGLSEQEWFFVAESPQFGEDEEDYELSIGKVDRVGGPFRSADAAADAMTSSFGNPGSVTIDQEPVPDDPLMTAAKGMLEERRCLGRSMNVDPKAFKDRYWAELVKPRPEPAADPGGSDGPSF